MREYAVALRVVVLRSTEHFAEFTRVTDDTAFSQFVYEPYLRFTDFQQFYFDFCSGTQFENLLSLFQQIVDKLGKLCYTESPTNQIP